MSAPRFRLALSPNAKQDFSDILVYTERQWGKRQRVAYKTAIDRALRRLTEYPNLGRPRDEFRPDLRSYLVEQHVIYYRIEGTVIRVDRILHEKMDVADHLEL